MSYDAYAYYETHGPMLENEYPYTAKNGVCQYSPSQALSVRTTGYVTVPFDDINQMKAALALKPLNVSIYGSATSFRNYKAGIYNDPLCGNQHNHATNVVGMGIENGVEYWVMRNSWGTGWGEGGYIRMAIVDGDGQCGV
jgi:C1A family cysteine protease